MNTIRTLIGASLSIGLIMGGAATASAAPTEVLGSGALAGGTTVAITGPGSSGEAKGPTTAPRDGGGGSFWQWGVSGGDTWSNYFRERRCHGATAVGKKTKRVTKVRVGSTPTRPRRRLPAATRRSTTTAEP